jgi:DNA-binding MarR family transcriptional regulator
VSREHYKASTYRAHSNIGYLMKRGHSLLVDLVEPVLEAHGLNFVQYAILMMLRDEFALNPATICRLYRHDSGALTRVIDQLVEGDFVERVRHDRDRRKVELQLTATGRKVLEALLPSVVAKLNHALGDFSAAELHELTRLLMKLNTHLQAVVEPETVVDAGS